ncbi:zinc finger protein 1 homolog [Scaptodrosophila lebanonensis]|uniref:Zinc finger protein 1 homolog n=1 Tax=Drosophila lebanonensis TaxID=7225 RepID=A0A6J2TGJ3_DROLE|nr:zinc finger protein 1 homolog [Scaptodrosophila lebanonensis]
MLDMNAYCDKEAALTYYDCFKICTKQDLRLISDEPTSLCKRCGVELQWAYDFYKKVEQANQHLRELRENFSLIMDKEPEEIVGEEDELVEEEQEQRVEEGDQEQLMAEDGTHHLTTNTEDDILLEDLVQFIPEDEEETAAATNDAESNVNISEECEQHLEDYTTPLEEPETLSYDKDLFSDSEIEGIVPPRHYEDEEEDTSKMYVVVKCAEDLVPHQRFFGQFRCQHCKKLFRNYSRMMRHQATHFPERPQYDCEQCDRSYRTKQALKVHVETKHEWTGYSCSVCGKLYAIRKALEIHMRYHTGDFPYACDQCDKKYAQSSHLKVHKNVHHRKQRFICDYPNCGKFFTSSNSLRNHQCTHSQMPFECSFCQHGYPARAKLRNHILRKHNKDLTLDELEGMRKFHIARSTPLLAQIVTEKN